MENHYYALNKLLPKIINMYNYFINSFEIEKHIKLDIYPHDEHRRYILRKKIIKYSNNLRLLIYYFINIRVKVDNVNFIYELYNFDFHINKDVLHFNLSFCLHIDNKKNVQYENIKQYNRLEAKLTIKNKKVDCTFPLSDYKIVLSKFPNLQEVKKFMNIFKESNDKGTVFKELDINNIDIKYVMRNLPDIIKCISNNMDIDKYLLFLNNSQEIANIIGRKINLMLSTHCIRDMFNCVLILCSHKRYDGDFSIFPRDLLAHILKNYVLCEWFN